MDSLFDFVESYMLEDRNDMLSKRVIPSFLGAARRNAFNEITDKTLRVWFADMMLKGVKLSTAKRYILSLRNLCQNSVFENVVDDLKMVAYTSCDMAKSNARIIPRLLGGNRGTAHAVFFYLLYNVKSTLREAISLKIEQAEDYCPQIEEIIKESKKSPQQKYVFPLGQGKKREGQIVHDLLASMRTILADTGMRFAEGFSESDIKALWIARAIECGISLVDIRSIVREIPSEYSFLSVLNPEEINLAKELHIINRVAESINDNSPRWFVMKIRNGYGPDDIKKATETTGFKEIEFFYPTHRVFRKEHGKRIYEDTPYLPGLMFFKYRRDKISSLFREIGNMAWCFRTTNSADSPYSVIPHYEMNVFQRHIGSFSSDIEMELVNRETELKVGEKVMVNGGGMFEGYQGIVRKVREHDGSTIYTLELSTSAYIQWKEINVSSAFVEPIAI